MSSREQGSSVRSPWRSPRRGSGNRSRSRYGVRRYSRRSTDLLFSRLLPRLERVCRYIGFSTLRQEGQTVRRFYAAPDVASMESCFAREAVWHSPGKSAVAGDHRSWPAIRDAIRDFQAKIGPHSGGTFRGELLDVAVGEQYIVAVQHGSARQEGRRFDVTAAS
jgi:hypothetical protein